MVMAVALGCCCSTGGLPWLGENRPSLSWKFFTVGMGISWTLGLDRLYIVNGIGFSLAAVAIAFTIDVCVVIAVVVTNSGFMLIGKDFQLAVS